MFGDLFGMMDKINKAKEAIQKTNEKLDTMTVEATSAQGYVKVICTGNKHITDIIFNDAVRTLDTDALQDYLVTTVNEALQLAQEMKSAETKRATDGLIPNIPGLDLSSLGL